MTKTSQAATSLKNKLVFMGTGPVAAASLDFLANHFAVEAVITKPRAAGHKGNVPVEELAHTRQLSLHFAANKHELDSLVRQASFSSSVGVVVDFGIIITQDVIDSFPKGIVNSHFSLLPRWRGADPISYTILSGDTKGGVSLMVIDAGLDTGKLITQRSLAITTKETTGSLTKKLIQLSNKLLLEYLPQYMRGEIVTKNQPHPDRATHSHKLAKSDAIIDWNESAVVIERKIRAYQPWPKARAKLGSVECIITEANVIPSRQQMAGTLSIGTGKDNEPPLCIECGEQALSVVALQPLGKKEMPVQAFLAGYKSRLLTSD